LRRVPVSFSEGFLEEGTARLREWQSSGDCVREWPASLREFTPVIVDGRKLKQVAKRLLLARGRAGKLSGGKLLVASCLVACVPTEGLARSFVADRDGEANDGKLMPNLIPRAAGHRGNATVDSGSAVLWSHATAAADSGRRSLRDSFSPGKPL
jgi:hypothetical protein